MNKEKPLVSVITPAFNEALNLPRLFSRLQEVFNKQNSTWEWIVVDDHSDDGSFEQVLKIAKENSNVNSIRFSRNFGSHTAISCAMNHAKGKCAVILAADLQDPPEEIPALLDEWKKGNQVVWAARSSRAGEQRRTKGFSLLYYFLMRRISGLKEMPYTGADFLLADRQVMDALCQFKEKNVSILALITWMGFRQSFVNYDKGARVYGQSGWSSKKKLKLVADSITSFTYFPIRLMSYSGFIFAFIGFAYAIHVVMNAILGSPAHGWSSLMVVVLIVGGVQMIMMGILGEYLWRALDESRRRPQYLVEASTYSQNNSEFHSP